VLTGVQGLACALAIAAAGAAGYLLGRRRSRREEARRLERLTGEARRAVEQEREACQIAVSQRLRRIAARLAHDVRSPVSALEVFLEAGPLPPETHAQVLRPALARLKSLADYVSGGALAREVLPGTGKGDSAPWSAEEPESQPVLLAAVIESVVSSARMEDAHQPADGLARREVELADREVPYGIFVHQPPSHLRRALDGLVRALLRETACVGGAVVRISAYEEGDHVIVRLAGSGERDASAAGATWLPAARPGGTGMLDAVQAADASLSACGGRAAIPDPAGSADIEAVLTLPAAGAPSWFLPRLEIAPDKPALVADDDLWVHHLWDRILDRARIATAGTGTGRTVHLYSLEALESFLGRADQAGGIGLFLIDESYGSSTESGLDIMERHREVLSRAVLVTARWEDPNLRARAMRLGLRLLPKNMVPRIEIAFAGTTPETEPSTRPDAVLVDDHIWIRKGWELSAARSGVRLLTCRSMPEFLAVQQALPRSTALFIDSDLGDEMTGEQFAATLFDQGFTNIYLATGFDAGGFPPMPWLRGVLGKDPPDWSMLRDAEPEPLDILARPGSEPLDIRSRPGPEAPDIRSRPGPEPPDIPARPGPRSPSPAGISP